MRYRIAHKTEYRYASEVAHSTHLVHLSPCQVEGQIVHKHEIAITPKPVHRKPFTDYFGNPTIHLTIEEDHSVLIVNALTIVDVSRDQSGLLAQSLESWEAVRNAMLDRNHVSEAEFACQSTYTHPSKEIADYAAISFTPGRPMLEATMDLTRRIFEDFEYDGTVTEISTPVAEVFEMRKGVCQDFAHFQLTCLRALGLPARYVSGYLRTYPPAGQPRLIGSDESHAWISAWCPETGWVDFDPTNNKMISDEHIVLTVGRDYSDVSPISGIILGGGSHFIEVSVDVAPIDEQGNEIGQAVEKKQSQQQSNTQAPLPAFEKSQPNVQERILEQTQSQHADQSAEAKPILADRTY